MHGATAWASRQQGRPRGRDKQGMASIIMPQRLKMTQRCRLQKLCMPGPLPPPQPFPPADLMPEKASTDRKRKRINIPQSGAHILRRRGMAGHGGAARRREKRGGERLVQDVRGGHEEVESAKQKAREERQDKASVGLLQLLLEAGLKLEFRCGTERAEEARSPHCRLSTS